MSAPTIPANRRDSAAALWGAGIVLIGVVSLLGWGLSRFPGWDAWPSYETWAGDLTSPLNWALWVIGDTNEAPFYKSALAGIGMTLGALLAHVLWRRRSRAMGIPVSYGSGRLPWILVASWVSLILANGMWQWTISDEFPWQPTFVTFVSVPAAVVLVYGGGWARALTAAVLGAVLTTPISILTVMYVCTPLELPSVVGNVTGMWAGGLIAFALCRRLPHMARTTEPADEDAGPPAAPSIQTPGWVVRRALADFTEPTFYGNEWASAGLLLGATLEFLLNPASPVYGSGLFPGVLAAQFIAATLGVLLFRRQWAEKGFYSTFIPIVSIAPALVVTFGSAPLVVAVAGVLGALAGPPLGDVLSRVLPPDFHPYIAYVFAMTVSVAVLVPLLRAVPGFGP
ncbi:hypothetical protein [Ornithinicoccus hortensis]|uniref:Uncharacterized protein n=1 Tax=Ornithinicoccus hortensis TaxID=82346 RepID=A0A542YWL8_9MICO|nr:hypothetical protein [Ornithinicoccus hortensis]TQL52477.1 hypothetical protein FB467_3664 [Ornithinicoccus hortensis]